jgi:hypothetical protein
MTSFHDTVHRGTLQVLTATASTSPTTGAVQITGGVGIQGAVWMGSTLNVAGAATFQNDIAVTGNGIVNGTFTVLGSTTMQSGARYLTLNNSYATDAAQTGGICVNYDPTTTSTTVATGGFSAATTVVTAGSGTFADGDIILVTGANNALNNRLFEVASHVGTTLTIEPSVAANHSFLHTAFTVDTTVAGTITKVNVSVLQAGVNGDWEVGKGSTAPLTFLDLPVGGTDGYYSHSGAVFNVATNGARNNIMTHTGAYQVDLPNAPANGTTYTFYNNSANTATIYTAQDASHTTTAGTDTINNGSDTSYAMTLQRERTTITYFSGNWAIV